MKSAIRLRERRRASRKRPASTPRQRLSRHALSSSLLPLPTPRIFHREAIPFYVQRHLVHGRPVAGRILAVSHNKNRRERTFALLFHQKGDLLHMVVLIPCNDIKDHPPELLLHRAVAIGESSAVPACDIGTR